MYIKGENLTRQERTKVNLFDLFAQVPEAPAVKKHVNHLPEDFNSKGYRSDELTRAGNVNICTVGAGETFGVALPRSERFSDHFCEILFQEKGVRAANWNFGLPHKSNDYITRIVASVVPILGPSHVFVVFQDLRRREHWTEHNECLDFVPDMSYRERRANLPSLLDTWMRVNSLSNHHDDSINFYKNYLLIETLLNSFQIPWLFATHNLLSSDRDVFLRTVDESKYVGDLGKRDFADDDIHPGPDSHEELAEKFYDKFQV